MKHRLVKAAIFLLILIEIFLSWQMTYANYTDKITGYCILTPSGTSSCLDVQNSEYGSVFGIKVSYFGFVSFLVLFVLYLFSSVRWKYKEKAFKLFLFATVIGFLFALYFVYLQVFSLKQICSTCMIVDVFALVILALGLADMKKRR